MHIPEFLVKLGNDFPEHRAWVESLPALVQKAKENWGLDLEKPFVDSATCSYVAPCTVGQKEKAVLKIGLPHEEALHEIDGLLLLNGNPTVRLLDYDRSSSSMLLEKCVSGEMLNIAPDMQQDEVICKMLTTIWKAHFQRKVFRPLSSMVKQWNSETLKNLHLFPDPRLAKQGCLVKEQLINSTVDRVFLATDLHAGNVLRAQRKEWLAIDIKPYFGDPAYDLTQHLLNCKERLADKPQRMISRVASLAGVDQSRVKEWLFARLASEENGANQQLAIALM